MAKIVGEKEQQSSTCITAREKELALFKDKKLKHFYNNGRLSVANNNVGCNHHNCCCLRKGITGPGYKGRGVNRGNPSFSNMYLVVP